MPGRYVDLEGVPRDPASGALQFQSFDFHSGKQGLPLVKLIDDFKVGWVPDCVWGGWAGVGCRWRRAKAAAAASWRCGIWGWVTATHPVPVYHPCLSHQPANVNHFAPAGGLGLPGL
jgi:hypothetical protein